MELLQASDFFDVPLIKKVSGKIPIKKLRKDSALESYKSAKSYNAEILKMEARKMVIEYKNEIMHGWMER